MNKILACPTHHDITNNFISKRKFCFWCGKPLVADIVPPPPAPCRCGYPFLRVDKFCEWCGLSKPTWWTRFRDNVKQRFFGLEETK